MKIPALSILLGLLLSGSAFASTGRSAETAFGEILKHYEAVRLALVTDTVDGVAEHARSIRQVVQRLDAEWSPERAGVRHEMAGEARRLLPELQQAASELAGAGDLDTARDAFYALSKPLVRYRKAASGDQPVVAYCSMARRSWLQPEGELGNPYYGQSMLRCGEVVDG